MARAKGERERVVSDKVRGIMKDPIIQGLT